jgi:hypothetical protein
MDSAQTGLSAMAALEATGHSQYATTSKRLGSDASIEIGKQ